MGEPHLRRPMSCGGTAADLREGAPHRSPARKSRAGFLVRRVHGILPSCWVRGNSDGDLGRREGRRSGRTGLPDRAGTAGQAHQRLTPSVAPGLSSRARAPSASAGAGAVLLWRGVPGLTCVRAVSAAPCRGRARAAEGEKRVYGRRAVSAGSSTLTALMMASTKITLSNTICGTQYAHTSVISISMRKQLVDSGGTWMTVMREESVRVISNTAVLGSAITGATGWSQNCYDSNLHGQKNRQGDKQDFVTGIHRVQLLDQNDLILSPWLTVSQLPQA